MLFFIACKINPGPLAVVFQSSEFGAEGEFQCTNNGRLFYRNETRVVSKKTRCLATAQWKDFDVIECRTGECKNLPQDKGTGQVNLLQAKPIIFNAGTPHTASKKQKLL